MYKKCLSLLIMCFLVMHGACAEIHVAKHIRDVSEEFYQNDLWVLVDLDDCLFESKQSLGHASWFYEIVAEKMKQGMSRTDAIAEFYPSWMKAQSHCRIGPVEQGVVDLLLDLQNRGVVVMGLTHRSPPIAKITIKQVASLGVDFSTSSANDSVRRLNAKFPALVHQGIIFVNDSNSKADVFHSFLKQTGAMPKKVLFIDDSLHNVKDLECLCAELHIPYTGIHYTASKENAHVYTREHADKEYQALTGL